MNNHICRTLLLIILTFYSLMSPASGVSKYSTLIREVRGWSSEKVLAMGDTLLQRHEDDKALVMYMLVCSRTNDNMTDKELTDCSLANMKAGDIFYDRGNYINALENYQTGLKLSESSKSKEHLASIYKNIGNAYCMFKDYDKGFEYYKKGYAIIPKGDKELTFKLLANLFGVCLNRKDLKEARKYRQLMQTSPHPETSETHFYITFSKALLTSEEAHYAEANKILIDLAKTSIAAKLPAIFVCSVYSRIYTNYMEMGDMSNALHYIHLCMQTAEKNRMMHYVPETLRDMAEIQKRSGNTSIAQQYDAQYLNLMDSIYNSQRFNVVKNQQFIYEVDKANKEITRLHQEEEIHRHNARLYQLLFLVSIIAVVLISVLLFYVLRQKRNLEVSYRKLYDMNRSNMVETEERKATRTSNMKDDQKQQLLEDIRRVMEETDEYCQQEFTVGSLAKLIGSNERYVSMVINDHYGKSFTERLNDCRIKKACERGTDDTEYANLTITAIGQSVGYKSQTTFIKQFRKCTGLTPSVYQKFVAEDRLNEHTVE